MISCNLQGGLGNQMFQIAATHALALRNNTGSCFDFGSCHTPMQGNTSTKYQNNVFSKFNNVSRSVNIHNFQSMYIEPRFGYNEIKFQNQMVLNGYFQSEKYFKDYKKEIIEMFNIPNETLVEDYLIAFKQMNRPITTVHVRRGDYLNNSEFHPACSIEYYKKAMDKIGDSSFIFVSDDMAWVQENFKGPNIWYSMFSDELSDLKLMTMVDNNIIANSSFSWWGAYLNTNPKKVVIAPKTWFGPKGPQDIEDIIPPNWSIIDF